MIIWRGRTREREREAYSRSASAVIYARRFSCARSERVREIDILSIAKRWVRSPRGRFNGPLNGEKYDGQKSHTRTRVANMFMSTSLSFFCSSRKNRASRSGPAVLRNEGDRRVRVARQYGDPEVPRAQLRGGFRRCD